MKILSVIIPSYNSEAYLVHCVETLLDSSEHIEIIIVNDGSVDKTGEIADRFAIDYPETVRVIHQENAGHGGAVMAGVKSAQGLYVKIVDSDDWVNSEVLDKIVRTLKKLVESEQAVDMLISDFIYDKVGVIDKKIMNYEGILPTDQVFTWNDTKRFPMNKYMLMHSVIYSRRVLEQCELELPKHTFYVDNLYVYLPLPYVERMYYINECLYHYFIGREDQSVNEKNMLKRLDQQLMVNKMMVEKIDIRKIKNRKKRRYMIHYLNLVTTVSSVLLLIKGTQEAVNSKNELWNYIKSQNILLHYKMRMSVLGNAVHVPSVIGKKVVRYGYTKAQERIGFN